MLAERLAGADEPSGGWDVNIGVRLMQTAEANDMIVDLEHPAAGHIQMVGPLFRMSAHEPVISRPPPMLGQHTDEVLRELGKTDSERKTLQEKGVVV